MCWARAQLEKAATAGVVVVAAVIGIIMYEAIKAGLPGITSGEVPIWSLEVRPALALRWASSTRNTANCCLQRVSSLAARC